MINIKPFKESYGACGPASLKMVLDHYEINKTEKELSELTKCTPDDGTTAENIVKVAKSLGLKAEFKDNCDVIDIFDYVINQKIPVIVDWYSVYEGHYSIVVDIDKENIYIQDPELGRLRAMRLKRFKSVWFDFPGEFIDKPENLILRRLIIIHK